MFILQEKKTDMKNLRDCQLIYVVFRRMVHVWDFYKFFGLNETIELINDKTK